MYRKLYDFEFNLEFILHEKVTKLHEPVGQMQFELSEKLTSVNQFQIEREKSRIIFF